MSWKAVLAVSCAMVFAGLAVPVWGEDPHPDWGACTRDTDMNGSDDQCIRTSDAAPWYFCSSYYAGHYHGDGTMCGTTPEDADSTANSGAGWAGSGAWGPWGGADPADEDGDGVADDGDPCPGSYCNECVNDCDSDGDANDVDDDVDGDGLLNIDDPDIDGDNIPNVLDPCPAGAWAGCHNSQHGGPGDTLEVWGDLDLDSDTILDGFECESNITNWCYTYHHTDPENTVSPKVYTAHTSCSGDWPCGCEPGAGPGAAGQSKDTAVLETDEPCDSGGGGGGEAHYGYPCIADLTSLDEGNPDWDGDGVLNEDDECPTCDGRLRVVGYYREDGSPGVYGDGGDAVWVTADIQVVGVEGCQCNGCPSYSAGVSQGGAYAGGQFIPTCANGADNDWDEDGTDNFADDDCPVACEGCSYCGRLENKFAEVWTDMSVKFGVDLLLAKFAELWDPPPCECGEDEDPEECAERCEAEADAFVKIPTFTIPLPTSIMGRAMPQSGIVVDLRPLFAEGSAYQPYLTGGFWLVRSLILVLVTVSLIPKFIKAL